MNGIRPFEARDLEQVAALYECAMRSGTRTPPPGLAPYLARVFLEGPDLTADMGPLVFESQGRVVAFLGAQVRRFRFDGKPVRIVASGPLVTEPDARLTAALLMRARLEGPQLLTVADGATADSVRLFERMSGHLEGIGVVRWTRVFRPWQLLSDHLARRGRIGRLWRPCQRLTGPLCFAADAATRALRDRFRAAPAADLHAEDLDPARLVEGLKALAPHHRLHPDHDEATSAWMFNELRFVWNRGPLRARLLRDAQGRIAGWYIYYAPRGRIGVVVQVVATPRMYESVLTHLFADADGLGVAALQGQMRPALVEPLWRLGARLDYAHCFTLVHSREPEVYAALMTGQALLSRFDGEWGFGFQSLPLTDAADSDGAAGPLRTASRSGSSYASAPRRSATR
jgi:hypothetical protein